MCLISIAFYPQAATNLQSCFGEEVGFNVSRKFIINLQWELPKGNKLIIIAFVHSVPILCVVYVTSIVVLKLLGTSFADPSPFSH